MINLASQLARRKEWLAQLRLRRSFEGSFSKMLSAEFDRVGREAKAQFMAGHQDIHIGDHAINLYKIFLSLYVSLMTTFSKRMLKAASKVKSSEQLVHVGWNVETKTFDIKPIDTSKATEEQIAQQISQFAKKWSARKVTQVSNTTKSRINRIISKGLNDGKPRSEIADDIYEKTGSDIGELRADVIARTETHTASQAGSLETAKSLGIGLKKVWVATNDDRTREDHSDVNGETVDMDDTFTVGDDELEYPGDPNGSPEEVINCRCVLVYENSEG